MANEYLSNPRLAAAAIAIGAVVVDNGSDRIAVTGAGTDAAIGVATTNAPAADDEITVATAGKVKTFQRTATAIPAGSRVVAANAGTDYGVKLFNPADFSAGDVVQIVGIARTASTSSGDSLWIDLGLDTVRI